MTYYRDGRFFEGEPDAVPICYRPRHAVCLMVRGLDSRYTVCAHGCGKAEKRGQT